MINLRKQVADFIVSLKAARHGCERCPAKPSKFWGWEAFDWDHYRGSKSFSIASAVPQARQHGQTLAEITSKIESEISKCQLLCSNCHRTVTRLRFIKTKQPIRQKQKPSIELQLRKLESRRKARRLRKQQASSTVKSKAPSSPPSWPVFCVSPGCTSPHLGQELGFLCENHLPAETSITP